MGQTRRHTVVIAEDQAEVRREIVALLSENYDVIAEAENGWQLINAAFDLDPDVLIVDLTMPALGGLEALRVIKSCNIRGKALILTTNTTALYIQQAFKLGADAYVLKAFAVEDLPAALNAVLSDKKFVSAHLHFDVPMN